MANPRAVNGRDLLIVVLTMATAFAVAFGVASSERSTYTADATVAVQASAETVPVLGAFDNGQDLTQQGQAELTAQLVQTMLQPRLFEATRRALHPRISVARLRHMVHVHARGLSGVVTVTARAHRPALAARVANTLAATEVRLAAHDARARYRQAAHDARAELRSVGTLALGAGGTLRFRHRISALSELASAATPVQLASRASPPTRAASPRPVRDGLIAAGVALLAGLGIALAVRRWEGTRSDADIAEDLGVPMAGWVPQPLLGGAGALRSEREREPFRIIFSRLQLLTAEEPVQVVAVTSALPEEGKSTVAAGVAAAAAAGGHRTALVEADTRRPVMAQRLGMDPTPGLAESLRGEVAPEEAGGDVAVLGALDDVTLRVVPAGATAADTLEGLSSGAIADVFERLRPRFDLIVVDSTPLLGLSDAVALVPHVDAVLMCVRDAETPRERVYDAVTALVRAPYRPTALVLTGTAPSDSGYAAYPARPSRPAEPVRA